MQCVICNIWEIGGRVGERARKAERSRECGRSRGEAEVVSLLLDKGANAKAKTKEGKTALDLAEENDTLKGTEAYDELRKRTLDQ